MTTVESGRLKLGMQVFARDGEELGRIGRIWYPDGKVEPADPEDQGTIQLASAERHVAAGTGFFQVARSFDLDWFVPFEEVASVNADRVMLKVTDADAERQGWQQKPVRDV
jgi:hypothetical protein